MANCKKIWWLLPLYCLAAGGLAAAVLQGLAGFAQHAAAKEGLLFCAMLVIAGSQALWIVLAYPTKVGLAAYAFATGLLTGCLAAWLHGLAEGWLIYDVHTQSPCAGGEALSAIRWLLYPALLLIFSITVALQRRLAETERRYAQQQDAVALLREAELFKLRQQLQPHFLYNSLNAISALVITAPDKAGEMISRLADFLRTAVKQGRAEQTPLAEELDYLRQYLWIEAVRFGDRLRIDWSGGELAAAATIPPFLLQPVMENAIRFAVYGTSGPVTVSVLIEHNEEMLRVTIRNPYDASMEESKGTGFGLEGIRRRFYLIYARHDLLQTAASDGHFTTTLLIPQ